MNNKSLLSHPLVVKAVAFATRAHAEVNHTRKYSQESYIVHPLAVMDILLKHCSQEVTPSMLAAAACHDVIEDAGISSSQVRDLLGEDVAEMVNWLTDISRPENGNRKTRKAMDHAHTAQAPVCVKNIKIADSVHNLCDITMHDPDFARVYIREKQTLMLVLQDADPAMISLVNKTIADCQDQLARASEKQ